MNNKKITVGVKIASLVLVVTALIMSWVQTVTVIGFSEAIKMSKASISIELFNADKVYSLVAIAIGVTGVISWVFGSIIAEKVRRLYWSVLAKRSRARSGK